MSGESTRIDRWLWAVRVYKTRALASEAARGGHVEINDHPAKPASTVKIGDRVKARAGSRVRELEVRKIIEKRVGPPVAAECFVDHTPAPKPDSLNSAPVFKRDARTGRPTKRDRRDLDRFRSRERDGGADLDLD
ncbi:MAG: RNA-binding S4 domain-containing protein [Solirubrobacteraceae bacterium]|nr:RNA-binding S4 domain-containing protein [Solirubrobacteraceae bacterium]